MSRDGSGLIPIRTSTLRADVPLEFDLYLLISGKHLLYVRRRDSLEGNRLGRLRDRKVGLVYIGAEDRESYQRYLVASARRAIDGHYVSAEERAEIIVGQSRAAVEQMFQEPETEESYRGAHAAASNQVALLLRRPETLKAMMQISEFDRDVYQHSVNTATVAVALARTLGAPIRTCDALGLGCLLHDLGKSEKGVLAELGNDQHPRAGAGLLLGKSYVSPEVLDIILLHEARIDGQGVPAGIRTLDQLFQVAALANAYDRAVTLEGQAPEAVCRALGDLEPPPYDPRLIRALAAIVRDTVGPGQTREC